MSAEVRGIVESVEQRTSKKGKPYFVAKVAGQTISSLEPFNFQQGQTVSIPVVKNGDFLNVEQGKTPQILAPGAQAGGAGSGVSAYQREAQPASNSPNWEAKDRRIVRMNTHANALELIKVAGLASLNIHSVEELAEEVKKVAHELEADIYR